MKELTCKLKVGIGTIVKPLLEVDEKPEEKIVSVTLLFVEKTKTVGDDGFRVHSISSVMDENAALLHCGDAKGQDETTIDKEKVSSITAKGEEGRLGMYVFGSAKLGIRDSAARRITLEKDAVR